MGEVHKNVGFWLISFLLSFQPAFLFSQHVLYGEHGNNPKAVYFDFEGSPYPDHMIPDTSLERCGSSLRNWYSLHPDQFSEILRQYGQVATSDFERDLYALNNEVLISWRDRIVEQAGDSLRPVFLVHGFRKPFKSSFETRNSVADFQVWEEKLVHVREHVLPIRVYWDGMYVCCFSMSAKKNRPLFEVFEQAIVQAGEGGRGLGSLLALIPLKNMEIQTHSLGAMVAVGCLRYLSSDPAGNPCDSLLVNLIAPAIGANAIEKLYEETDAISRNGWRLNLLCNRKDFVLRKKDFFIGIFGPGPYRHGNTSLGCDHRNSAIKLSKRVSEEFPDAPVQYWLLRDVGKCHHIYCYTRSEVFTRAIR